MTTGTETTITGVEIKELITHTDERGFFRELIRMNDPIFTEGFAQCSHTFTHAGAAKAWHYHKQQVDWWYVVTGVVKVVLYDMREESSTHQTIQEILMGDHHAARLLKIPPGVAHGYKVLQGPMHLIYMTSRIYDPDDEFRLSPDDPDIGYDWRTTLIK